MVTERDSKADASRACPSSEQNEECLKHQGLNLCTVANLPSSYTRLIKPDFRVSPPTDAALQFFGN